MKRKLKLEIIGICLHVVFCINTCYCCSFIGILIVFLLITKIRILANSEHIGELRQRNARNCRVGRNCHKLRNLSLRRRNNNPGRYGSWGKCRLVRNCWWNLK